MKIKNDTERFVKKIPVKTYTEKDEAVRKIIYEAFEKSKQDKSVFVQPNIWRMILWGKFGYLAAVFFVISTLVVYCVLSGKVNDLRNDLAQRDAAIAQMDDSATINLYLREHQDFIARQASLNSVTSQPVQIRVSQRDIMYYEFIDDQPEYMSPGIIIRGPSSQHQISSPEAPTISNGHTLSLSEAKETTNFDLVAPSWLRPCYILDQIRRIEGRDVLQLLYTDGINSISLFEQPLDGQRGLEPIDFREYAVYRNQGQVGGTILAWKDDALSYVLIGNTEISRLMGIAQSINAEK